MVSRSTIAVALVVAMAMLGGCSGILGDGSANSPDEFDYADGFNADGINDSEQAAETYRQALSNKSNYTATIQQNFSGGDINLAYERINRVDIDDEHAYQRTEFLDESLQQEVYHGSERRVTRQSNATQEEVVAEDTDFRLDDLTGRGVLSQLLSESAEFKTSVEERDGASVVRYEASGNESATEMYNFNEETPTSFSASLAVDSEGVVRSASYDLTYENANGQEQTVTLNFEVTDINDTSVERPDWAEDA